MEHAWCGTDVRPVSDGRLTSGLISHNVFMNWFRKPTLPPNRQLDISISNSKQKVDDFVGGLTV
jgi:hypothetical protein